MIMPLKPIKIID